MVETGSLKLYQNRPGPVQEKCCLENVENFSLTLFWYSPTNESFLKPKNFCDIVGYGDITSSVIVGNLSINLKFFSFVQTTIYGIIHNFKK